MTPVWKWSLGLWSLVRVKNKLPTITILGVQNFTSKEEFIENVVKQNPQLKDKVDQFSVIYSKNPREPSEEGNKGKYQVVARVSEEVRRIIKNADDKLYMDMVALKVVDRFYIKRCNNCQKFGHYEKDCTSETNT